MYALMIYSLKVGACLAVFYLFFKLLLSRETFHRLNRIEGQVRGVRAMVEEERYCVDIITQASAISSALNAFNKALLSQHIKTCVADNIRNGNDDVVDELCETLKKLMK